MIEISNIEVWGFEHSIRGMRNPMNSWEKSDSNGDEIGDADLGLMKRLYKAGTEHRKYLRQIMVRLDINAPLYWWKEFDTYKIGTTANSCSTMHKITAKEFDLGEFSTDKLSEVSLERMKVVIEWLNEYRDEYIKNKSKNIWWQIIQMLPSSYNQKRTITMNYENVINIIKQRSGHKLDEWRTFVDELKQLKLIKDLIEE